MGEVGHSFLGSGPAPAPSIKRSDPVGWLCASACAGAALGLFALVALWRPLPWLPAPNGALADHLVYWIEALVRLAFPRWFRTSAAQYAVFWASQSQPEQVALVWRCAVAIWAAAMPAVLLRSDYMSPRDGLIHLRGSRRHGRGESPALLRAKFKLACKRRPDHAIAPGVPWPADMWTRQTLVVGGTGAGKSTLIKPLVDKIVAANEPLILFDPKGDFTSQWAGPAIVAPWDARSLAWDIARDLRNLGDARKFAESMIAGSATDPMWSNASRQILVGFVMHLKAERGDDWGWADLAQLVSAPQPELHDMMLASHAEAFRSVERQSVTTQGILINLASFCSPIFDLARAWGDHPPERRISFVDWARGDSPHKQVVLQGHASYSELSACYARGIVEAVASLVASVELDDDPSRKLWIVADEFPQMGKVPIRALFEVGRSRGVRCVLACQDFAQLDEIHGEKLVRALVSMSGTLVVGQIQQGDTADLLCKALGAREVERANVSSSIQGGAARSATLSYARDEIAIYKPSELGSRLGLAADGKGVVMALVAGGEAHELFWPLHPRRKERPAHVPAPWTTGAARKNRAQPVRGLLPVPPGPANPRAETLGGLARLSSDAARLAGGSAMAVDDDALEAMASGCASEADALDDGRALGDASANAADRRKARPAPELSERLMEQMLRESGLG